MPEFNTALKAGVLKSLANASITGSYVAVGSVLAHPYRVIYITNTCDTDMLISWDGVNDHFVVPTKQSLSLDGSANCFNNSGYVAQGTQVYVKYVSAPASGSVYVAGVYT